MKKKIVLIDAHTINPGDLNWEAIEKFGECTVYPRTNPSETFERCKDAQVIITSKVLFDRDLISRLPKLEYIGVIATGYNVVDLDTATEKNIVVTNIPSYCSNSVAQMVFAHMMEFANHVGNHDKTVHQGKWFDCKDFCYWDHPQTELNGKILGLIGYGNIGKTVSQIATAFGMNVIAYDIKPDGADSLTTFVDLDDVFKRSDILSLHCPLTPETKEIINKSNLTKMKPNSILINTGRGPLVNENDLAWALNENVIAGAGLDVLAVEPPIKSNPLLTAKNCHLTPHIAWASRESRERLIQMTADNIEAFYQGNPRNKVN